MMTYKDYQALAAKVYDKDNTIVVYNNPKDANDKTTWTKVALEKDATGKVIK